MPVSRLLITGGSSYLGQHLVPMAVKQVSSEVTYTFYQNDPLRTAQGRWLNVLDETAVAQLIGDVRPDAIIHTIGSNRSRDMEAVIRQGTEYVTRAASAVGARLVHISTDVIFDGRQGPYDESAQPRPLNAYGRAKVGAEIHAGGHDNCVIVRTSLIYGLKKMDHGTRWMAEALQADKPVTLFSNQRRNPVWVESLCRACLELAAGSTVGVLNVAGDQVISRADFALRMLDWWGITRRNTLSIGPYDGEQWPLDCSLSLGRAKSVLSTPLPGVDAVLEAGKRKAPRASS